MRQHQYSFLERALHRLAFASWPIQTALADMEQVSFKARLADIAIDRPVFVAGLPRAGTTLILQLIENCGEFASYRYRDMPFLLCPMLWDQFSGGAARSVEVRERAHGDGIAIGLDSPEAFEEVVWRTFWPKRYERSRIRPWSKAVDPDFETFFRLQMRKVIAIRSQASPQATRYLSKCNGNIARLNVIAAMIPDAVLLVPYRDPVEQASSLLFQHLNFLQMHKADAFAREYMAGIGHYDFGENLKPIDFSGWLGEAALDFTTLDAWLRYWCAAYGFLAAQTDLPIHFISHDGLRKNPGQELARLEALLGVGRAGALTSQIGEVRPASPRPAEAMDVDAGLLAEAARIMALLQQREGAQPRARRPRKAKAVPPAA